LPWSLPGGATPPPPAAPIPTANALAREPARVHLKRYADTAGGAAPCCGQLSRRSGAWPLWFEEFGREAEPQGLPNKASLPLVWRISRRTRSAFTERRLCNLRRRPIRIRVARMRGCGGPRVADGRFAHRSWTPSNARTSEDCG
jgi:hypothetical protein